MRIFLTGSGGFIGRNIYSRLWEEFHPIFSTLDAEIFDLFSYYSTIIDREDKPRVMSDLYLDRCKARSDI